VAAGLLVSCASGNVKTIVASAAVAGVAALLPDLDATRSKVGRLFPVLSWVIKKVAGHRGPLHSLLGAAGIYVLANAFLHAPARFLIPAIVVGYLSHVVLDSFTPQGCPWLWPLNKYLAVPFTHTGGSLEKVVIFPALLVLDAALIWSAIKAIQA